jgi:benzil reductase ((S)-benzoin forming)
MNKSCLYIITGVNRGLGEALFNLLQKQKKAILAISRSFTKEQKRLKKENIHLLQQDLSEQISLEKKKQILTILNSYTKVVFINNASLIKPIGKIGSFNDEEIINTYFVNSIAPALLTNLITKNNNITLIVLNISSGAAKRSIQGWAFYCATKAANEMFFNTITEGNITIINYNPGVIDTRMQEEIRNVSKEQMPNVADFKKLQQDKKLKKPTLVAKEILNLIP